ncbi:MAG: hypothetical protein HYU03_01945, partial [Thaumarchaeota archaeon]|nr:hypothetical protein [Nitrososphaerota archaeon]
MKGIEVAETAQQENQNKLWITCITCGITKAFYTPHGVRYFELSHLNHEVRKGKTETEELEPMAKEEAAEATPEPLEDEGPVELPTVQVEKFVVSLVTSGAEKKQSLRVRGIGPEEKDLFVLNFPAEKASAVRALIELGEYIEDEIPPMGRFTWTPELLDVSDQVSSLLGLHKPGNEAESPKEVVPVTEVVAVPEPAQAEKAEEVTQPEAKVAAVPAIQRREIKKEVPLLLAKSSYIQENEENRNEATRISKVLMEFRWNIAPPYGINVLFDDNMSIQSNTGVISAGLVKKIEEIGYKFVAFEASHGAPTAWFKKNGKEDGAQQALFPDFGEVILP